VASAFELTLVDVAFWVGLLVFQLPVGVLADKYGRRPSILVWEGLRCLGILGYGLGASFLTFIGVNLVWSLGAAFAIGTSAYLYDALLEEGYESEFPRYIGRTTMIQLTSNAAGAFAGGLLVAATGDIQLTLLVGAAWNLTAFAVASTFVEPNVPRATEETYVRQIREGFRIVRRREGVALLIAFEIVLGVTLYSMALFRPLYLTDALGVPEAQYAVVVSAFLLVAAAVSAFAGDIASRLGEFGTIAAIVAIASGGFLGMFVLGPSPFAILLQAPIYIAWSLQPIMTTAFLNRRLEPGQRATVLSMGAFAFTLVLAIAEPLVGYATTVTEDLLLLGLLLGVATLVPGTFIALRWRSSVAPWPAVTPLPSRLLPGGGRVSRFHRLLERLSRFRP